MLTRIRSRLSYANVMATAAVVVALGGGALAATSPVGSDGKIRGCVGTRGKLTVLTPPKKKCRRGQTAVTWNQAGRVGQPGASGPKGDQGDRGPQGESGVQGLTGLTGLTGDTGAQGPGTMTINQQVARDGNSHTITTINGLTISVLCAPAGPNDHTTVDVTAPDSDHFYHAWGTQTSFSVTPASTLIQGSNGQPLGIGGIGDSQSILQLDVVAAARLASPPVRFTHFLLDVQSVNACNFHGLVIPPS